MIDLPREDGRPAPEALAELAGRYGLEVRPESIPRLLEEHGLRFEPFRAS
jgi:hypothetical protein